VVPVGVRTATIASTLLLALSVFVGLATSAQAASFTVGTTKDVSGTCASPAAGTCSLRQLIDYEDKLAATPSPPDTIVVPAGTYNLANGELEITQSLTIAGAGARTTHVEARTGARAFDIKVPTTGGAPTVVISGLEISGGTASESNGFFGGNVYNAGSLLLDEDWITEGTASSGGGVSNDTGTLKVERSLISDNHASTGGGDSGGIQNHGSEVCGATCVPGKKAVLTVEDSTIADNDARLGGGIFSWSDATDGNEVSVIDSTIADNSARNETGGAVRGPGGGLLVSDGTADVAGSIIAFNDEISEVEFLESNCAVSGSGKIASLGYNLVNTTDCGFASTGDLQEVSPSFTSAEPQSNGGNTNTLALEPTSPGVDAIPTSNRFCTGIDQRGVTRPQGAGCEIGAVELVPFTIEATEGTLFSGNITTARCSISGTPTIEWGDGQKSNATVHEGVIGGSHTYAEAGTYNGSVSYEDDCGAHKFPFQAKVAALSGTNEPVGPAGSSGGGGGEGPSGGGNPPGGGTPGQGVRGFVSSAPGPATLATLPPPVLGKTANVDVVSGKVFVSLPSTGYVSLAGPPLETAVESLSKGFKFIPLTEARQIPVGSTLETTGGVVAIATATATVGKTQAGEFGAGIFTLLQNRKQKGLTELDIVDNHSAKQACFTLGKKAQTASKHLSSKVLGRLTGTAHGGFTTRGQYSAATVRGTVWGVRNRCDGTLTKVTRGIVSVRDFRRRKTITLFTGQSYLAKAP
jgi:hypothetical protein